MKRSASSIPGVKNLLSGLYPEQLTMSSLKFYNFNLAYSTLKGKNTLF